MKKILFILFLLSLNFAARSQQPITQNLGSDSTLIRLGATYNGILKGGIVVGAFTDTTVANNTHIDFYTGAMIWSTSDTSLYVRNKTSTSGYWFKIGGAGGGAGGAYWALTGNAMAAIPSGFGIGTNSTDALPFKTDATTRMILPANGLVRSSGAANKYVTFDTTTKLLYYGDGGSGSTPTWQQTLDVTNGKKLTSNVEIDADTHNFGIIDVNDWYVDLNTNEWAIQGNGGGSDNITVIANALSHNLRLVNGRNANVKSEIYSEPEYIELQPYQGDFRIDTLSNNTNQDKVIGWVDQITGRGRVGYLNLGSGLSISSGTLNTSGTVPTPISSLTAATASNNINNGNFTQGWAWNSLTTDGLVISSSSTSVVDANLMTLTFTGANASPSASYNLLVQNLKTGVGSTNIGAYITASGATTNYAIVVPASGGDVGIGIAAPTSKLHIVPTQTTGIGVNVASSTTTSGSIMSITGTSTALAANNEGLNIGISGANATNAITATGATISVTNTNATSGTNVGIDITASGATTANLHLLLREPAASGTNYTAFTTQAQAADLVYTLPAAYPAVSGYALTATTAGVMSWAAVSSGITVGTTTITSGTDKRMAYNNAGVYGETAGVEYGNTNILWRSQAQAATDVAIVGKAHASQSANIFEVQNSSGTAIGRVTSAGRFGATDYYDIIGTDISMGNVLGTGYNVLNANATQGIKFRDNAANVPFTWEFGSSTTARSVVTGARVLEYQGTDVASAAGAIALSYGNLFEITGTASITRISNINWQNGSIVRLMFTSTATLVDGTANSGTDIGIELSNNISFTAVAGDIITLALSEIGGVQAWREATASGAITIDATGVPIASSSGNNITIKSLADGTNIDVVNTSSTVATINITGTIPIANGGTNNGSLSVTAGTIYYGDGTKLVGLAPGTAAQHLTGGTTPSWKDTATAGGGSPAGNFGNIQINRAGALATPASDSLDFESATGLSVKGDINSTAVVDATTGFQINNAAASGKVLMGNGTNYVASTPTFPTSASTNGNLIVSDGTNFASTAPTYNEYVRGIQALGSSIKVTAPLYMAMYQEDASFYSFAFTDGRVQYSAIYLDKPATITGVSWYQRTQGNYTADNYNGVGLYSYSGGTLTLVASSTDDGNIWKAAANAWATKAFSSTYAAAAGVYFIGAVWNASATTTAPQISAGRSVGNSNEMSMDFTNSAGLSMRKTGTTLPASVACSTMDAIDVSKPFLVIY